MAILWIYIFKSDGGEENGVLCIAFSSPSPKEAIGAKGVSAAAMAALERKDLREVEFAIY